MLSTGLFDSSLCVKFYGFVLKTKYFIRIFFSSKLLDLVISAFYNSMTEALEFGKLLGNDMLSCSKIFLSFLFFVSITQY